MADCSYARCVQERRFIKRELQKWTKDIVYIVGLERVAEELMGRRKWKLYQEVLARSHLNSNPTLSILPLKHSTKSGGVNCSNGHSEKEHMHQQKLLESYSNEYEVATLKKESNIKEEPKCDTAETEKPGESSFPIKLELTETVNSHSDETATQSNTTPIPIDWEPQKKCNFCVDGKLLTVNELGELVAESSSVRSESELANRTSVESDSDSSECSNSGVDNSIGAKSHKLATNQLLNTPQQPQSMTSFESMAAQLATIASLNGFPPLYPGILYNQIVHQMQSGGTDTSATLSSNATPKSPVDASTEQPLDLSAKPTGAPMFQNNDSKQIYRAKPRLSTVSGRRTYTEDELQNALQDILSGKLGTRRAAVLYGIPRSTLRNKVYKLATEQKREASLLAPVNVLDDDDEDKELSGAEDDKDIEKAIESSMRINNAAALAATPCSSRATMSMPKYGIPDDNTILKEDLVGKEKLKSHTTSQSSQPCSMTTNPWLDPVVLQNLIIAGGFMQQKYDDPSFQELFRNLLIQQQELMKEQLFDKSEQSNNRQTPVPDSCSTIDGLALLQQHQQPVQHQHQLPIRQSVNSSNTPDIASSLDAGDVNEDAAVILKIPSFKPVAGSTLRCKNGDNMNEATLRNVSPISSRSPHNTSVGSPPVLRSNTDSQSPPISVSGKNMLSLRDVIAKSITRTFNQQSSETIVQPPIEPYKRPSISVIKNLGGTDISRFASSPNMMGSLGSNNSNTQSGLSGSAGGKGTRPKRGKYRNYDRDSLIEAVKAVQRGEMSVHRAGSYYGVPHSTLEYKVKERHLMRPRKREPKPQPLDSASTSSLGTNKSQDVSGSNSITNLRTLDKSKPLAKAPLKTPPFSDTTPNGLKLNMFDPSQLQYAPHLFWPHSPAGYTGLPLDFARGTAANTSSTSFTANSDNFFASQMMQRFQEDALRQAAGLSSRSTSGKPLDNTTTDSQSKTTREIAERLYEGTNVNGSFLDGIIRHSLDRKAGDISHGVLLDQLVKNNKDSSAITSQKRIGSPIDFAQTDIKRERTSPSSVDSDRDSNDHDISKESNDNNKYHDNYVLSLENKTLRHSTEDLNGDSSVNKVHITENEDSS